MTTIGQRALAVATDTKGEIDEEKYERELKRLTAKRNKRLLDDAQATGRAMTGWSAVKTQEDWENTMQQADKDFLEGRFLIEQLGAKVHVDPTMTAVIMRMRSELINEYNATTTAELMIIDSAVLSYYHLLRVTGWMGNLEQELESEFFGRRPLSATLEDHYGTSEIRGLRVEEIVDQLVQKIMPMFERMNRMMLRNLAALKTWRQPPAPSVSVESAGQVNVGQQQVNVTQNDDVKTLGG